MKIIEFKIRRFKELVTGILLGNGTEWSLIRVNVVDYVLDGFQFTNKKYIAYERELNESTMRHRILSIKNRTEYLSPIEKDTVLNDNELLFSFLKRKEILVAICLHKEDVIYVGRIKDVKPNSFDFDSYDPELRKSGVMKIDYSKVRYVQVHTDYLDSLSLLLGHED
ncbi:MAG: hypothetical protein IJ604_15245 [Prevotella sp.]|nr:hypothetical protein [Prevotella sp.]